MQLTDMDYVRGTILNAMDEGMTLCDVWKMSEHAKTCKSFDRAVNILANTGVSEMSEDKKKEKPKFTKAQLDRIKAMSRGK